MVQRMQGFLFWVVGCCLKNKFMLCYTCETCRHGMFVPCSCCTGSTAWLQSKTYAGTAARLESCSEHSIFSIQKVKGCRLGRSCHLQLQQCWLHAAAEQWLCLAQMPHPCRHGPDPGAHHRPSAASGGPQGSAQLVELEPAWCQTRLQATTVRSMGLLQCCQDCCDAYETATRFVRS